MRRIALSDPGIDDYRGDMLWSPNHPNLIGAELELIDEKGEVIDRVESYAAMRSVACRGSIHFKRRGRSSEAGFGSGVLARRAG